jgi:3-oxoacyl-[acyl-carrier-protein] synthase II
LSDDIYIAGSAVWTKEPLQPARWADKPAKLSRMDRLCALALVAADGAVIDAGCPKLDGERTAVVFGSAYGCHATNEDYYRGLMREGPAGASPRLFAYTLPSSPAGPSRMRPR